MVSCQDFSNCASDLAVVVARDITLVPREQVMVVVVL
jgi:uncharacterized protein with PhoU and TrkA domain